MPTVLKHLLWMKTFGIRFFVQPEHNFVSPSQFERFRNHESELYRLISFASPSLKNLNINSHINDLNQYAYHQKRSTEDVLLKLPDRITVGLHLDK